MNYRKIVVFDFETDGKDPETANPVELAAIVLDPRKLTQLRNAEFHAHIKPYGIDDVDEDDKPTYFTEARMDTIQWHAKMKGCSTTDIIESWRKGQSEEHAWKDFANFVNEFNRKKTYWTAPIAAGANIIDYDLVIASRLNKRYGINDFFWKRDRLDVLQFCFPWFESMSDGPQNYKMDTLREYLQIENNGNAHEALPDVKDSAQVIVKFLNLHRKIAKKVQWNVNKTPAATA